MSNTIRYRDERDKCYGVTGMAIGIAALDAESMLEAVSLDGDADSTVELTAEFYFAGNPRYSARLAWKQILEHYRLSVAMVISNVMCRRYVLDSATIDAPTRSALLELVRTEGRESCSLDEDETRALFDKSFSYLSRLFSHPGVQSVAHDFAKTLTARRRLSRAEVLDELRQLSFL